MISKEIMSEHAMTGVKKIQAPAVLAIWTDVTAQAEAEFNEWYWREHVPERLVSPDSCAAADTVRSKAHPAILRPTTWSQRRC